MSDHLALRAGVPPFYVMDVLRAAAERQRSHGDLVDLSAGQPSAGAPEPVRAATTAITGTRLGSIVGKRTKTVYLKWLLATLIAATAIKVWISIL